MKKRKIRIAMIATNLKLNGISSVIMNYIRYLDLSRYSISLIVGKGVAPQYKKICYSKNIRIFELPPRKESPFLFYLNLYKILLTHKYDMVHVHGSNASIGMELLLAKFAGIKIRIAHSHNTTSTNMIIHKLMKPIFNFSYTDGFACGKLAGKWLFGNNKFTIIPNGIQVNKFKFDPKIRTRVRDQLNLTGKFVIGHIGRFNYQKNHEFLLQVFKRVEETNKNAVLLLVGRGPNFNRFKHTLDNSSLSKKIILYGETNHPERLYMAMDYFVFPSRFEGLPLTLIEAQVSGLPCLVSDCITPEVKISPNLHFMSLKNSPLKWSKKILSTNTFKRRIFFENNLESIRHYQIQQDVKILDNAYQKILDR